MTEQEKRFLAVQFSEQHDGRGWGVLDRYQIPVIRVISVRDLLTYIFSTDKFEDIEKDLRQERIGYRFVEGTSFSKKILEEEENWQRRSI